MFRDDRRNNSKKYLQLAYLQHPENVFLNFTSNQSRQEFNPSICWSVHTNEGSNRAPLSVLRFEMCFQSSLTSLWARKRPGPVHSHGHYSIHRQTHLNLNVAKNEINEDRLKQGEMGEKGFSEVYSLSDSETLCPVGLSIRCHVLFLSRKTRVIRWEKSDTCSI